MLAEIERLLGYPLERYTDFPVLSDQESDHLGIIEQKQPGLYAVGVSFAGGRVRNALAQQVRRTGREVRRAGAGHHPH